MLPGGLLGAAGGGLASSSLLPIPNHHSHRHFWSPTSSKETSDGKESDKASSTASPPDEKKEGESSSEGGAGATAAGTGKEEEEGRGGRDAAPSSSSGPTAEEYGALEKLLKEAGEKEVKLSDQVKDLTDRLMRSLAEMENVRTRSTREVDNAKRFGPQALVKDLLDVPDNLERAAASVPQAVIDGDEEADAEKLKKLLRGLLEGVRATEKILMQVLRKQGVERYDPAGEKFDPNLHSALFEVPDGTKDPGVVAVVTKKGYRLHERVIRPADVGVTRAP